MGVIFRQSMKSSLVNYVGAAIGAVLVLFIYPRFLQPEQIGLLRILLDIAVIFAFYSQLGLSNSIVKFHSHFDFSDKKALRAIHWSLILIPLVGFGFFLIAFYLFRGKIEGVFIKNSKLLLEYFDYLVPLTFFLMFISVIEAWTSVLMRIVVPKFNREIVLRLFTLILLVIFFFKIITFPQLILYYVISHALILIFDIWYAASISGFSFGSISFSIFNKAFVKAFSTFSVYILCTGAFSLLIGKVDAIMLSSLKGLTMTGVYSIAMYIAAFIDFPARSVIQISTPIISTALKDNDIATLRKIYLKNTHNQIIITGLIYVLILINSGSFFQIMPNGGVYSQGIMVIALIGLGKFFDSITSLNIQILTYSKYYYYSFFVMIFVGIASIALNYFLIVKMGIIGAAIAFALSYFLYNGVLLILLYQKFKIVPFSFENLKALILLLFILIPGYIIPQIGNAYIDIVLRSGLIVGVYVIILYRLKLSKDINELIASFLKEKSIKKLFFGK